MTDHEAYLANLTETLLNFVNIAATLYSHLLLACALIIAVLQAQSKGPGLSLNEGKMTFSSQFFQICTQWKTMMNIAIPVYLSHSPNLLLLFH